MTYVIAPTNSDILHYGTKRHSGRYPYGSGKEPYQDMKSSKSKDYKLTAYKSRESERLEKEKNKLSKKIEKSDKPESKSTLRKKDRVRQINAELDVVNNMSFDDMSKEKRAMAIATFESALVTVGTYIAPVPIWLIMYPDYKNVKTNNRIGETNTDVWRNARKQYKDIKSAKKAGESS